MAGKFKFKHLRSDVYNSIVSNYKLLSVFVLAYFCFFMVFALGLGGIGTLWFLLWGLGFYLLNFVFFRWYFKRSPYLLTMKFFDTLLPAVKFMLMIMLTLTVLAFLPYLPLLFGSVSDSIKRMITLFIGDFMGESNTYNFMISFILFLFSPVILYRPLLAWVAATIGRSGSFKNVFKRTIGYNRLFLKVLFVFYLLVGMILTMHYFEVSCIWLCLVIAPVNILFSLFLAETYKSLFLD